MKNSRRHHKFYTIKKHAVVPILALCNHTNGYPNQVSHSRMVIWQYGSQLRIEPRTSGWTHMPSTLGRYPVHTYTHMGDDTKNSLKRHRIALIRSSFSNTY